MPPEFSYASLDEVVRYFVSKQAEAVTDATEVIYDSSAVGRDWADVPDSTALEVYRIVQEATGNAMKHSGSDRIAVSLTLTEDGLRPPSPTTARGARGHRQPGAESDSTRCAAAPAPSAEKSRSNRSGPRAPWSD